MTTPVESEQKDRFQGKLSLPYTFFAIVSLTD